MKEVLDINLGQCGIQIANSYWKSYKNYILSGRNDIDVSSFYNIDRVDFNQSLFDNANNLRARCILIDTELGPTTKVVDEQLYNLIATENIIAGTEATGNNWGVGYREYGPKYLETLSETIRQEVEGYESFQYFNVTFGISGGTGSGLGSYLLEMLSDAYPSIPKVTNVITNDNICTISPYNTSLCLNKLHETSTMIIPFSNEALLERVIQQAKMAIAEGSVKSEAYFEPMNNLICKFITQFKDTMVSNLMNNIDINSFTTSLVPFPLLNILSPSLIEEDYHNQYYSLDQLFYDLTKDNNKLSPLLKNTKMQPLAMGVITKDGNLENLRCIKRLKLRQRMLTWNRDGVKVNLTHPYDTRDGNMDIRLESNPTGMPEHLNGNSDLETQKLQGFPPPREGNTIIKAVFPPQSYLYLANHCGISEYMQSVIKNVESLLNKKAFLHHFKFATEDDIRESIHGVGDLCQLYDHQNSLQFSIEKMQKSRTNDILAGFPSNLTNTHPFKFAAKVLI